MREDIDCLTSVAKLRELFEEWKNGLTLGSFATFDEFADWLAIRDNEPRFVALAHATNEWMDEMYAMADGVGVNEK